MKSFLNQRFYWLFLGLFVLSACSDPADGGDGQEVTASDTLQGDADESDLSDAPGEGDGEDSDAEGTDVEDDTLADADDADDVDDVAGDTTESDAPDTEVDPDDASQGSCESEECRRQGRICELLDGVPTCTECLDGYVVNDIGICIDGERQDCVSLDCAGQNRHCQFDRDGGAQCLNCLPGFYEDDAGNCVAEPVADCDSLGCEAQNRRCQVDLQGGARCMGCLPGFYEDDAGNCMPEPVVDCESLNCEAQNRACNIDLQEGASCGLCLHGFEEDGEGRCVPLPGCEELNCAAEHRGCVVDRWGEGACAGCLSGYFENDDGLCEAYPTCADLGCAAQKRNCNIEMGGGFSCGGCIFNHWENVDTCVPATVCGADEYQSAPLRTDADRECSPLTVCKFGETESRAPTATTDRECTIVGRQPIPSVNVSIGYNALDWLMNLNDVDLPRTFAELRELGVRMVRTDLRWKNIQPHGPDDYNWTRFDLVMGAAHAEGIQLFPIIQGSPDWARAPGTPTNAMPDLAALEKFARVAAERLAPYGIHYWQAWNEPNMKSFFTPMDEAKYAQVLTAIYTGVKAGNPDAFVVSAGIAAAPDEGPNHKHALEFTAGYLAHNPPMDAFAFHGYTFPRSPLDTSPTARWTGWNMMVNNTPNARQIMIDAGYGDKDIWVTEYGAPTSYINEDGQQKGVTEAEQAQFTNEAITLCQGLAFCGTYFHYSFRDIWYIEDTSQEAHFGILYEDWTPKPAAATILSWASAPLYFPQ